MTNDEAIQMPKDVLEAKAETHHLNIDSKVNHLEMDLTVLVTVEPRKKRMHIQLSFTVND